MLKLTGARHEDPFSVSMTGGGTVTDSEVTIIYGRFVKNYHQLQRELVANDD